MAPRFQSDAYFGSFIFSLLMTPQKGHLLALFHWRSFLMQLAQKYRPQASQYRQFPPPLLQPGH